MLWNDEFVEGPSKSSTFWLRPPRIKINWNDIVVLELTIFTNRLFLQSSNGTKIYYSLYKKDDGSFDVKVREILAKNVKV